MKSVTGKKRLKKENDENINLLYIIRNGKKAEAKKELSKQIKNGDIRENLNENIIMECFNKDWVGIAKSLLEIMNRDEIRSKECLIRIVMTCDDALLKKFIVRKGLDYNGEYYDVFLALCEYGQNSAVKSIIAISMIDPDLNDQQCIKMAASKHNYKLVDILKKNLTIDEKEGAKVNAYLAISRVI